MLLFHGTTLENALNIKENGFSYDKQVWDCSLEETYFYTEDFFRGECVEDCDFSELWDYAINHTLDQARITLAVENPSVYKGAVLVFDTSLMENGGDIEPDYSCDNMDGMAVALSDPDMKGLVAIIYSDNDEKESRPFILASMSMNDYFCMPEMSMTLEIIVTSLKKNNNYFCIFENLNENIDLKTIWLNKNFTNQDHIVEQELMEAA